MNTVAVKGGLIAWARDRSGLEVGELLHKFPKLTEWEKEVAHPTFKQLESLARKTMTPLGYFFLPNPPEETLPLPSFRTVKDRPIERPSPNLLETVQTMQRRQNWMHDFLIEEGAEPLPFVGSIGIDADIVDAARIVRSYLGLKEDWAQQYLWWKEALSALREAADGAGIILAKNGVVGNNPYRKLDVYEFRGFVLIDNHAPLIFVNGRDSEGAQMFTIAHELVHVWLGTSGLFNLVDMQPFDNEAERFCNHVAAEFLVPELKMREQWPEARRQGNPFKRLSKNFKVSPLVVARRALDLNFITHGQFIEFYVKYKDEQEELLLKKKKNKKSGGDFYNNQNVRVGKSFASAVIRAAKEGRLLYRDAFRLTGLHGRTFDEYSKRLGFN
jgi:Zn-dependent peptidase ImmA (M78 family)